MNLPRRPGLLRTDGHVSTVELFFDLVYVFAVTQLSHRLVEHLSIEGAVQTAILLAMVWQAWVYTTWSTNYLNPAHDAVRAALLVLMLASLVMSAGLSEAFESRGLLVALAYVTIQLGRCLFEITALRGQALQMTFVRILPWTSTTSTIVIVGAFAHGHVREVMWASAVVIDLVGAGIGFYVPGLRLSATREWTVSGAHFAERCQSFVLIALGESIVVTGTQIASIHRPSGAEITAFVVAFAVSAGLWWIYFDHSAQDSAEVIESSADPGKLARDAFHWVHPLIIGGIIVGAAADESVLQHPSAQGHLTTSWLVLGAVALYLGGHALFKAVIWRLVSWPRVIGAAVCLALFALAPHVCALTLSAATLAVIVAVAAADRFWRPAAVSPAQ